jgi:hypothetical protein
MLDNYLKSGWRNFRIQKLFSNQPLWIVDRVFFGVASFSDYSI